MTRRDAQALLDALGGYWPMRVQVLRDKRGVVTTVVATWRELAEVRATEADALAHLVAKAYRRAGRPVPDAARVMALPGVG